MDSQDRAVKNIKALMRKRGWNKTMLADFAGLSRAHVGDLLEGRASTHGSGRMKMTLVTLDKLADALEVSTAELLTDSKTADKAKGDTGRSR